MSSTTVLILAVLAIIVAIGLVMYVLRRRTTLKQRFGPEYERTVHATGSAVRADSELEARANRVSRYKIRPLAPEDVTFFANAWKRLQARFVDDPPGAVTEADALVTDLMSKRGYPMAEFDRRAEDLSVDHGDVVHHYREAHRIASQQQGQSRLAASTEDLRQAVVHYRALFEDLLQSGDSSRRVSA